MDKKREQPDDTSGRNGPAAGTIDHPIAPDQAQPGDRSELGANLGGPIDVFPGMKRGSVDHNTPGEPPHQNRVGPSKERP
jgi:hypothetical protein